MEDSARLLNLLTGAWTTQVVYVAAELGLADCIAEGCCTSVELAARTGADEPALRRLLDALTAIGICRTSTSGAYELTSTGALLRSGQSDSLRSWALWWGRSLWQAWGHLLHSVRTGESARVLTTGTRGFDHLSQDREAAAVFYQATVELSRLSAPAILAAHDFSKLETIVDVGGGYGELLVAILRANPTADGILFELPQAIVGARQHLGGSGVGDRCELVEGDFFRQVPTGADAYVLKSVLHDWNDEDAGRILASCRRAMGARSRLLVVERVRNADENGPPQRETALSDLTMLVAHGAGERTAQEFGALLNASGFDVIREVPIDATLRLIEAVPRARPAANPRRNP